MLILKDVCVIVQSAEDSKTTTGLSDGVEERKTTPHQIYQHLSHYYGTAFLFSIIGEEAMK